MQSYKKQYLFVIAVTILVFLSPYYINYNVTINAEITQELTVYNNTNEAHVVPTVETTYMTAEIIEGTGIGNQLFVYATLYGLAKRNNKTAFIAIVNKFPINKYFKLSIIPSRLFSITFVQVCLFHITFGTFVVSNVHLKCI
jgi:hypothetical protein